MAWMANAGVCVESHRQTVFCGKAINKLTNAGKRSYDTLINLDSPQMERGRDKRVFIGPGYRPNKRSGRGGYLLFGPDRVEFRASYNIRCSMYDVRLLVEIRGVEPLAS